MYIACDYGPKALENKFKYYLITYIPANTVRWPNADSMLVHRLRRWSNIKPTLDERLICPGWPLNNFWWVTLYTH